MLLPSSLPLPSWFSSILIRLFAPPSNRQSCACISSVFNPPISSLLIFNSQYTLATVSHVTRQPGDMMLWPNHVHSIWEEKALQISCSRPDSIREQPTSRDIIELLNSWAAKFGVISKHPRMLPYRKNIRITLDLVAVSSASAKGAKSVLTN